MNPFRLIVEGLKAIRDIINGVRDARRADVVEAVRGQAAGRAASDAATRAGQCALPLDGWYCTREAGHRGPCAANPGFRE